MARRNYGGPLVEMTGAVDLHCHPYPDLFPPTGRRLRHRAGRSRCGNEGDCPQVPPREHHCTLPISCKECCPASRSSVVSSLTTTSAASILQRWRPPCALVARKYGCQPLTPATTPEVHGGTGGYDSQSGGRSLSEGIWVADNEGKLRPEVKEVLGLVAEHKAILGSCHLAHREIVALVREARDVGVEKIVITHPYFKVPNLDLDTLEEVARLGAMPNSATARSRRPGITAVEKVVESIQRIGASRCLLVSDTGQRHNPLPSEALRIFAQTVFEKGLALSDVERMIGATHSTFSIQTATLPCPRTILLGQRTG